MEQLAGPEKIIATIGAIVVGIVALVALKNDWKTTGLDNNVTKLLLGLMALGCVLVLIATAGLLPRASGG
jgi:chromate transport protein ChrA